MIPSLHLPICQPFIFFGEDTSVQIFGHLLKNELLDFLLLSFCTSYILDIKPLQVMRFTNVLLCDLCLHSLKSIFGRAAVLDLGEV